MKKFAHIGVYSRLEMHRHASYLSGLVALEEITPVIYFGKCRLSRDCTLGLRPEREDGHLGRAGKTHIGANGTQAAADKDLGVFSGVFTVDVVSAVFNLHGCVAYEGYSALAAMSMARELQAHGEAASEGIKHIGFVDQREHGLVLMAAETGWGIHFA